MKMNWQYDKGEHRHKHDWNKDEAGFVCNGKKLIAKCPNTITHPQAKAILNNGIVYVNRRKPVISCIVKIGRREKTVDFPHAVYNIHEGIPYRALPALGCCSFHAFPEIEFPPEIEKELIERAKSQGRERELRKWLAHWRKERKKCRK
ncbi:MAG: hypothetical protein GY862_26030 [Gammaproteobacteria bacterium]|nr:hypothetical protein [Gammaproteobacteria bacterium]